MIAPVTVIEGTLRGFVVCFNLFVSYRKQIKKNYKGLIAKGNSRKALGTHRGSKEIWERTGGKYVKHKMQTGKKLNIASALQVIWKKLLPNGNLMEGQACLLRTSQAPRHISSSDQCRGDRDRTGGSASRRGRSHFVMTYHIKSSGMT